LGVVVVIVFVVVVIIYWVRRMMVFSWRFFVEASVVIVVYWERQMSVSKGELATVGWTVSFSISVSFYQSACLWSYPSVDRQLILSIRRKNRK
jgi:hypothetical protein